MKLTNYQNYKKVFQNTDIPTNISKSNADLFTNYVCRSYNCYLEKVEFPCVLKHADVVPLLRKKKKKQIIETILPDTSKIYKKLMYQQLYDHFYSLTKTIWFL